MKNSKSKVKKVEDVEQIEKNEPTQKQVLKAEFTDLYLLDEPTTEQKKRMVEINRELSAIAKVEKEAQKEINARMKKMEAEAKIAEANEKSEKAYSILHGSLLDLVDEMEGEIAAGMTKALISKYLGTLKNISSNVRVELPTVGTLSNSERNEKQLQRAILHIENGGELHELPETTQKSYNRHIESLA